MLRLMLKFFRLLLGVFVFIGGYVGLMLSCIMGVLSVDVDVVVRLMYREMSGVRKCFMVDDR